MAGKKKKKIMKLAVGACVCALLGIGLIAVRQKASDYEAAKKPEKEMIIDLTADDIKAISYTPESGSEIAFVREEGLWKCTSDPDITVDQTKVGILASSVTGCAISHTIKDVEDLAQYGLEEPRIFLSVTDMDGNETDLKIGSTNDTTFDVYCIRNNDEKTVYAVSTGLITDLEQPIEDYVKEEPVSEISEAEPVSEISEAETVSGVHSES